MQIPLIDLKAQYAQIKPEIDDALHQVLSEGMFIGGEKVTDFEKEFAKKSQAKYCISVGNGTDALYLALMALGIKEGDEVITTASSWISTASTILKTGATPIFVDIEEDYYTIDVKLIEAKITSRTKAIIPVHLYGQMANMDDIKSICDEYHLYCVEDGAQAHFAHLSGKIPGQIGDIGTFSFYPTKNLGAYGDGGALVTDSDELAQKCRALANYGNIEHNDKIIVGGNSRLDTLQAAILSVKLRHVNSWIEQRIAHARTYQNLLQEIEQITLPEVRQNARHTYYTYVIRCENRDELIQHLQNRGITTAIHYPILLPLMSAFEYLKNQPEGFPIASQYQDAILSLPMYAELTNDQITYVSTCIRDFYN